MTGLTSQTNSSANVLTAVLLSGGAVFFLQEILAPLLLAVFLLVLVVDLSKLLKRLAPKSPQNLALGISLLVIVAAFGLMFLIITDNLTGLVKQADE